MPGPAAADILRTPDTRFADLPGFPYAPRYLEVEGLRIACIDEGPRDAPVVLWGVDAPGATINATVFGAPLPAVTADANGRFSVAVPAAPKTSNRSAT